MPLQRESKVAQRTVQPQRKSKVSKEAILLCNLIEVQLYYESIGKQDLAEILGFLARDIDRRGFIPEPISA